MENYVRKDPIELYTHNLYSYIDHWIEIFSIFPRKRSIPRFPSSPLTGIKSTGKNASQHPQFIFARGNHSGLANSSQRHLTRNGGSVILSCIYIYMYTCFSFGRRESVHSLVKSSPVWFFRLQVVRSVDELLIRLRSPLISLSLAFTNVPVPYDFSNYFHLSY